MDDLKGLSKQFMAVAAGVREESANLLKSVGDEIVADMKENVPVDTGALKQSIRDEMETSESETSCYIYADAKSNPGDKMKDKTRVPYAEFVEYGTGIHNATGGGRQTEWRYQTADGKWYKTVGQKAQPFIRPAVARNEGKLAEGMEALLDISKYFKYKK